MLFPIGDIMNNLYETLKERGYIYQVTDEDKVREILNGEPITAYVGVDPTADSLHIGHCLPLILAKYLQDAGHRVIVVMGGATAMIGDPSGKSDMRKMVTADFIESNKAGIRESIGKFLRLDGDNSAMILNNLDWFKGYDYLDFMRDIGVHFNVNQMLACDAYKNRLENGGLTFFEMGYMLMQAYDFVYLNKTYGCCLEFGGSDQWANILAGANLGRKLALRDGKDPEIFQAFTNTLLLNAEGKKMGKTEKGALWVNAEKCSPYDFYQYFYNCFDADVEKLFKILTYLSLDEIASIMSGDIRDAKHRLAYEITRLVHGKDEADKASTSAKNVFSGNNMADAPEYSIDSTDVSLIDVLVECGLCSTKSEARRLMDENAISLDGIKVKDYYTMLSAEHFAKGYVVLQKGKKNFRKITIK